MRVEVTALLEKPVLPLDYRRFIMSWLKSSLQLENPALFKKLYSKEKTVQKDLTFFARLPYGTIFTKDDIKLTNNQFIITFSTADPVFAIDIYNSIINRKKTKYPMENNNSMKVERCRIFNTEEIVNKEILITMRSPLLTRFHKKGEKDKFYIYNEEEFQTYFQHCITYQLDSLGIKADEPVELISVAPKKVVVKCFGILLPGSYGIYKLRAEPHILDILYKTGLGSKRNSGFGGFDVIVAGR